MKLELGEKVKYTGRFVRRRDKIGEVKEIENTSQGEVYGIQWPNEPLLQWYVFPLNLGAIEKI